MTASRHLCTIDQIPDGGAIGAATRPDAPFFDLIVLRRGREVFAYYNECPHAGRNLDWSPGRFLVKDGLIVCAAHGASFAVESGLCRAGPGGGGLVPAPVVVDGEDVLLAVGATDPA
ncbi:Rieske (2Fe-2S) protein [Dokdonella koreensis]|uniref:Ferredoxin, 2Fe-2S n=1 Tax=Dokdonella koreensis DS-123 TaxID=1300342 RepID=A0A160DSE8_9GAMM|nr:Rieske 2Fe-2S domain-containing protein [Dokdonella koreensis]ANB17185.1 Ferredoxin, 2Fe-2S [Dokdonella koreensis DS-123]